jgi:hypothetical protein
VSTPQPVAERVALFGTSLYASALVFEAIRSRAWLVAVLFTVMAISVQWVGGSRARYRLGLAALEVSEHFPSRAHVVRLPTSDVLDFVASAGAVSVLTRGGDTLELPRGTMRSDDEARALAEFLREHLGDLRERAAGYRAF